MEDSIHERIIKDTRLYQFQKRLEEHEWVYEIRIDQLQVLYSLDQLVLENRINKSFI
jgi:predicted O-linked N-acetylglucosamine transferase (SPINDLY family)